MGSGKRGRAKDIDKLKEAEEKKKEEKKEKPKLEKRIEQRALVRVANTDLIGDKQIVEAIKGIRGIGHTIAQAIVKAANLEPATKLSSLTEQEIEKLEQVIKNPEQFGIPGFLFNRRKSPETGQDAHLTGQDLTAQQRFDVQ